MRKSYKNKDDFLIYLIMYDYKNKEKLKNFVCRMYRDYGESDVDMI